MNTVSLWPQDDNPPMKRCSKCKQPKPATTEFFYRDKNSLRSDCKVCSSTSKKPKVPDGQKLCVGPCGRVLDATAEYFYRRKTTKDGFDYRCKDCRKEYDLHNQERRKAIGDVYDDRPEVKARRHANEKERRNNPESREDFLAMKRASWARCQAHLKEYYSRPEVREQKRINDRKRYHDPVIGPHVKEQKRARTLNYIARKKAVSGTYTPQQIQEQLKRQKHRCYYAACGFSKFEKKNGKYIYHIDHTFPLSRVVGTDIPANSIDYIVLACPKCNMNKKNKFPWEWSEGGRLL